MLAEPNRRSELFGLLQQLPTIQLDEIVSRRASQLVAVEPAALAGLLAGRLPEQIDRLLESLRPEPRLEYALLAALHDQAQVERREREDAAKGGEQEPEQDKLELSPGSLERFLELMCDVEPERVSFISFCSIYFRVLGVFSFVLCFFSVKLKVRHEPMILFNA